jgi:hypothetical protein
VSAADCPALGPRGVRCGRWNQPAAHSDGRHQAGRVTWAYDAAPDDLLEDVDGLPPFTSTAVFNRERTHRFSLTRSWGDNGRQCTFVMLNPSTADAFQVDPTIRRCLGFAAREGCDRLAVVNLFALRSTDPKALYGHPDPTGGQVNDAAILRAALGAVLVVAAWGAHGALNGRGRAVAAALVGSGVELQALTVTKGSHPGHPLYVRRDAPLLPYEAPALNLTEAATGAAPARQEATA